jgi:hypothetical protein
MGRKLIFLKKDYISDTVTGSGKSGDRALFRVRNGEIMMTSATDLAEIADYSKSLQNGTFSKRRTEKNGLEIYLHR